MIHATSLFYTRSIKGDSVLYRGLSENTCARDYGAFEYIGKLGRSGFCGDQYFITEGIVSNRIWMEKMYISSGLDIS